MDKTQAMEQPTQQGAQERRNPFFEDYATPHGTVPFDRITPGDFEEAFTEGIRREDEQIARITSNPERPTFDNTIAPQESGQESRYYGLLGRVSEVFFNLLSADTTDEMDALAERLQPMLTKHANDVRLNKALFERVKAVHRRHRILSGEEKRLLDDCYDGFVRSGAALGDEGKERLRRLTDEAAALSLRFSQNLLKEEKAFALHITDPGSLDGLPATAVEAAAQTARERGEEGWVFTLDQPSYGPFMAHSTQRDLRRRMYMAKNTACARGGENDNTEVCRRLLDIRRETAQLLGHKTYADYVLSRRMAGSRRGVERLLGQLAEAYRPAALRDVERVEREARADQGEGFELRPWDFSFYAHKLQLRRYAFDAETLRPYLELGRVAEGVFALATRLYGVTFREAPAIPVYHPDVKAYEVLDRDGSYLAVLYADFHPRKGKQGGAWTTQFQGQWIEPDGTNVRPHVSVVMNLSKPTDGKPALLTLGEVETFLHEFGHALHAIFANTRFASLSGTNVWWDFVELPSQLMESYATEPRFLATFARHYQTGEPMPDELVARVRRSRRFMAAYGCMRQVGFALIDMALHSLAAPADSPVAELEREAQAPAAVGPQAEGTCMAAQFSHIMAGGYAAGYYSYKWAEVLAADAYSVFERRGIFDAATAQRFRDHVLSRGGTEHPMTLYRRFRRGLPTIAALLRRDGVRPPAKRSPGRPPRRGAESKGRRRGGR